MNEIMSIKVEGSKIDIKVSNDANLFMLYGLLEIYIKHLEGVLKDKQFTHNVKQDYMG